MTWLCLDPCGSGDPVRSPVSGCRRDPDQDCHSGRGHPARRQWVAPGGRQETARRHQAKPCRHLHVLKGLGERTVQASTGYAWLDLDAGAWTKTGPPRADRAPHWRQQRATGLHSPRLAPLSAGDRDRGVADRPPRGVETPGSDAPIPFRLDCIPVAPPSHLAGFRFRTRLVGQRGGDAEPRSRAAG